MAARILRFRARQALDLADVPTEDLLTEIRRRVRLRALPPTNLFGVIPPPLWREEPREQDALIVVKVR